MKINLEDCKTAPQAVTKICYNESTRSLDYRIECENMEDLKKCVSIIDGYNEFDHRIINAELDLHAKFKRFYNADNPNNGSDLLKYDIGREGSPVMYIKFFNFSIGETKYIAENGEIREFTMDLFKREMETLSKTAKADEFSIDDDGGYIVCRLWWD